MDRLWALFAATSRALGPALAVPLALLLAAGLVPAASAANVWTFDWGGTCTYYQPAATGTATACNGVSAGKGWPAGKPSAGNLTTMAVYQNAGGSGYDVRVTVTADDANYFTGTTPALSTTANNPSSTTIRELTIQQNFFEQTNPGDYTIIKVEFCQSGATNTSCTAKGAAVDAWTAKDIDIASGGNGTAYRDVVTMTAVCASGNATCTAGNQIDPDGISAAASTQNWTAGANGPGCSTKTGTGSCSAANTVYAKNGGAACSENDKICWATFIFAQKLVNSVTAVYQPGDMNGATNSGAQYIWFSNFTFSNSVTQAVVTNVRAYFEAGVPWIEWQTASEIGTAGFHLLRRDDASGGFVRVNDALLPAVLESTQGGIYRYRDPGILAGGTYTYRLDEIEVAGSVRHSGPYTVTVSASKAATAKAAAVGAATMAAPGERYQRQAKALKGRAAGPATSDKATATAAANTAIRILVKRDGLYYVTANEIAAALGGSLTQVRSLIGAGRLRLRQNGQPVAWRADPGNNQLYFYGQAVTGTDALYTRYNVYWLDSAPGTTMNVVPGTGPAPAAGLQPFQSHVHVEQNFYGKPFFVTDPNADFWFWAPVAPSFGMDAVLNVPVPDAATTAVEQVTLTAYLQGSTDLFQGNDHHAHVLVNGTEVGSVAWDGIAPAVLTTPPFAASLLAADGNNTVTVHGELDPPVDYSVFWVNGFDIDYPRNYQADNDQLQLRGAGNPVVTVGNFSGSSIAVLDVSNPKTPRWIAATTITPDGSGGWAVSFVPGSPTADYLAAVPAVPEAVVGDAGSNLKSTDNGAGYLVLAPASLRSGANALADYRHGKVVDLQDIYDEFSYGIANPNAIRDFLAYASKNWKTKPRYVALVGKGTFDPKDYLNLHTNLFPVLMTSTPYGLTSSDNHYVDLDNNGTPDIAVGRIPALTNADVTNYVAKIDAYEHGRGSAKQALLVADNPDPAGDFTTDSVGVAQALPKSFKTTTDYLALLPAAQVRQTILDTLNSSTGVGLFNYVGHGATDLLADEVIFSSGDVSLLTNGAKLPIFAAFTCLAGDGSYPGADSLAEVLLWQQGGGAAASFAPTGLSDDAQAHILNVSMVRAMYGPKASATLGDAAVAAIADLAGQGGARFMLEMYSITGDPALRIQ